VFIIDPTLLTGDLFTKQSILHVVPSIYRKYRVSMKVALLDKIVAGPWSAEHALLPNLFECMFSAALPFVSGSWIRENSSDNRFEILLMKRLLQDECVGISRLQRGRPIAGHEDKGDLTRS